MKSPKALILLNLILAALSTAPLTLWAQNDAAPQTPEQVAYVKLIEGEVGYLRGDDNQSQWNAASVNVPLMTGDSLYANENGKAEVQLDENSFLRLGSGAYVGVLQNTGQLFQLKLTSGTATLRLQQLDRAYEIDTPSMAFTPRQPGEYRIDVNSSGDSEITLHEGQGVVSMAEGREESLSAPARLRILSTSQAPQTDTYVTGDAWDQWSRERDNLAFRSASRQYIPPGVYGYEAMDGYGRWVNSPAYGWAWAPTVAPSWQPYRQGRWVWMDPYGWTWVSYEPWGWAPYHYGRWAYADEGWMWVPGQPTVRQNFAAALVAFLGGDTWMGWMPLGPGEIYQPIYQREVYVTQPVVRYVNYRYVTVINRTEIYNVTRIYNYRTIDRRIIERTRVMTTCNVLPRRETLYVPGPRQLGGRSVQDNSHWKPPIQVARTQVYAKNSAVPEVRGFDQKLADIRKLGTVRPVNPIMTNRAAETAGTATRSTPLIKPVGVVKTPVAERGIHPSSVAENPKPVPPSDAKRFPVPQKPPASQSSGPTSISPDGGRKTFAVPPQQATGHPNGTGPTSSGASGATTPTTNRPKVFHIPSPQPGVSPAMQNAGTQRTTGQQSVYQPPAQGQRSVYTPPRPTNGTEPKTSGVSGATTPTTNGPKVFHIPSPQPGVSPAMQKAGTQRTTGQQSVYQPPPQEQRSVYSPPRPTSGGNPSQSPNVYQSSRPQGQTPVYQPPVVNRPASPQGGYQYPGNQPVQQTRPQSPVYQQPRPQVAPQPVQQQRSVQPQVQQPQQQTPPPQQQQKQQEDKKKKN